MYGSIFKELSIYYRCFFFESWQSANNADETLMKAKKLRRAEEKTAGDFGSFKLYTNNYTNESHVKW